VGEQRLTSLRHKKFRIQKSTGKFSPRFFVIKTASPSLITFQRAKLRTRNNNHFSGAIEGYFEEIILNFNAVIEGHFVGTTPRALKVTKWVLVLHDNAPSHRSLATHKKPAYPGY
jgi:hypothetical protein